MNNIKQIESQNNNTAVNILKGLICSFTVTLISIFIFSLILVFTNISENIIPIAIIVLTFSSILIGTIISTNKISKNGMLNGITIGGVYVIGLFLISSLLNTGFNFNIYTIFMILAGIVSGIIGGIIGVNMHH